MPLAPGTHLGPYEIIAPLGAGGMGEVYRARDVRHDRLVAVKVLRSDACPVNGAERFLREIRIAAHLTHPHILPLIDSGESGGVLFYVMPYIEGETLRERIAGMGELPIPESIRILRHVTDALAYAHARGVIHRDIKPENVLLSDRHALVADFGVAKALSDLSSSAMTATTNLITAMGTTVGTPAYMAPEQVGGDVVDHRADLYAIGVAAYDMLGEIEAAAEEQTKTPASVEIANQLAEHRFTLTERVCRKLNRATLDPRIIGDHLDYVENQVRSDVLVFFLHGLGLDHRDFEPILKRLRYRGASPTLYGCESERRGRISLSLADHVVILREWLREVRERFQPATLVMVGFSLGADMGFELLLGPADEPTPRIDAFLSLGCNLNFDTCFVSRVLASIAPEHPEMSIGDLRRLGDSAISLDEWLNIHEYLVKVLRKFEGDIGVLQRSAADIVWPLKEMPGFDVFARWFRGARECLPVLRLVFPNDSGSMAALARLKLENLDTGILGGEFPEGTITVSASGDHFDLMTAEHVLRQVDELVAEARAQQNRW